MEYKIWKGRAGIIAFSERVNRVFCWLKPADSLIDKKAGKLWRISGMDIYMTDREVDKFRDAASEAVRQGVAEFFWKGEKYILEEDGV